ncbi:hypothetical protein [Pseudomonas sp. NA-150]|uniref:hypothetical protein n=1 Tax=Pseudomonas sp. NA-150 TaxID=3367525 RepID=UPI0037CBDBE4
MSDSTKAQEYTRDTSIQIPERRSETILDDLGIALNDAMASSVLTPYGPVPLANALESTDIEISRPASIQLNAIIKKIEPILRRDNRFPGDDNYALRSAITRSGIYPNKSIEAMLYRAKKSGSTPDAIAWLIRVLATKNGNVNLVETLWGLSIQEPLQLTENIQLLPLSKLPESAQKKFFVPGADRGFKCSWTIPRVISDSPGGALVGQMELKYCVHKYAPEQQQWDELAKDQNLIAGLMEEFHDIAMLITLIGYNPVIGTAIWMEYEDADLKCYGDFLSSWSARSIETIPRAGQVYQPVDLSEIQNIISDFQRLNTQAKLKVRVALERFNLALRRGSLGDRAIDLSIALESLVGGNESSEVTHKVTTRTARLLGSDLTQRSRIRDIVKATYTYRSAMVHNGQQPTKAKMILEERTEAKEILKQAGVVCADLIKTILRLGDTPEWQSFDIAP